MALGIHRRQILSGATSLLAARMLAPLNAYAGSRKEPVRIGEMTSYARLPHFSRPYRMGWMLAMEQINQNGGVFDGRLLEIVSRDDMGTPADAQNVAMKLASEEKIVALMGSSFAGVADAVSTWANRHPMPFLAIQPLTDHLALERATRHDRPDPGASFLLRPSLITQAAIMAEQAARLPVRKWTIIAPDYEFGRIVAAAFQTDLMTLNPDAAIISTEWVPLAHINAPDTVTRIIQTGPEAIFNACFGQDLVALFREGLSRGLFVRRPFVSLLTGEPEFLTDLNQIFVGDLELWGPAPFIVSGYAPQLVGLPSHQKFYDAYLARYAAEPEMASVLGYSAVYALVAGIRRGAGGIRSPLDADILIKNLAGVSFDTPFGKTTLRIRDHQSTLGIFVGQLGVSDNRIAMVDARYLDGQNYLPADEAFNPTP